MAQTQQQQSGHADKHGNSLAAWTGVIIMMVGFLVGAVGVVVGQKIFLAVGVVVILAGVAAGIVMTSMGFGVKGKSHS